MKLKMQFEEAFLTSENTLGITFSNPKNKNLRVTVWETKGKHLSSTTITGDVSSLVDNLINNWDKYLSRFFKGGNTK